MRSLHQAIAVLGGISAENANALFQDGRRGGTGSVALPVTSALAFFSKLIQDWKKREGKTGYSHAIIFEYYTRPSVSPFPLPNTLD